ncbi:RNA recognition motif [Medicago truncatula]|uniref:RNA recognition motif n=1 Tax=Medicago truncatula TaxID=3880 RepID=A0A072UTR1_MEDTR|nr:RNA recognition motif [Medicago truncatula]
MATLGGISSSLLSHSKPCTSVFRHLFLRRITSKIFVKGLAFSTTEEKLAEAFSQYGNVVKADIVLNKAKKRCKGFGYVTFAEEEEARKAQIGMNGKVRTYKPKVSKHSLSELRNSENESTLSADITRTCLICRHGST